MDVSDICFWVVKVIALSAILTIMGAFSIVLWDKAIRKHGKRHKK